MNFGEQIWRILSEDMFEILFSTMKKKGKKKEKRKKRKEKIIKK